MKIPTVLPITAEQSRASRFQLGLTQAIVIDESGLPGYKLKQFETGRFVPDMPFLEKLRDFYASRGIEFEDAVPPASVVGANDSPKPAAPGRGLVPFFLMNDLAAAQLNAVSDRIIENDERISGILASPVQEGFFGGWSEDTQSKQRELYAALAENYMLIARLQGRIFVQQPSETPKTHADLLADAFKGSPLALLVAGEQADDEADFADIDEETEEQQ